MARLVPALAAALLLLAGCSGSDDAATDTLPVAESIASTSPPTTPAPVVTDPPAPTTTIVTEGATVIVANGNIVGGSAGRMTDALAAVGFTVGPAVNGTEKIESSIVYHADTPAAEAVAASVAAQLGGVTVEVLPEAVPIEGELTGEVLVLLGNLQADRTISELSGAPAAEEIDPIPNAGSTVIVANGSGIAGSAGRMSGQLESAGFVVGTPTNSTAQASESVVYFDTAAADATVVFADAEALAAVLGGIAVLELPNDVPTDSGSLDGDILLVLGVAEADVPLSDFAD